MPGGAATVAAIAGLAADGWFGADEAVVALNTGAGVKYPERRTTTGPVLEPTDTIPAQAVG